jgi:hypothetical protein
VQAEEILDLRAGNQHRNAVGKTDDDGPRNELYRGAHSGCAQNDEDSARHHGAHVQTVNAVHGDDPRYHDDKRAGGTTNLCFRSAECRNQKASDHCAVNAGLRRQSGCYGKGHGQRQGDQANRDSSDHVFQKLVRTVFAQADNGLGQPAVVQL